MRRSASELRKILRLQARLEKRRAIGEQSHEVRPEDSTRASRNPREARRQDRRELIPGGSAAPSGDVKRMQLRCLKLTSSKGLLDPPHAITCLNAFTNDSISDF